jgi:hypothetical protein
VEVPGGTSPPLIGVVVVTALQQQHVDADAGLHVVLQLLAQRVLKLPGGTRRIGSEAEVTLCGSMPSEATRVLLRWPLPQPDLDGHSNVLQKTYGISANKTGDAVLHRLRCLALASRAGGPPAAAADKELRQRLAVAAGHAVAAHILQEWNTVIPVDEDVIMR